MCLGMPGQIITMHDEVAVVDFWGVRKAVRLDALEAAPQPGDYVINHAGYAVRVIPAHEVADTLALYETVLAEAGSLCEAETADAAVLVPVG